MKIIKIAFIVAIFCLTTEITLAESRFVATIKPIHSLISGVLEDVDTPELIVDGTNSPHTFNLKPSHAHTLEHAKYIFWMGSTLEPYLAKSINTLGKNATVVDLSKLPGLNQIPIRTGGAFEEHDHDHGHTEHDAHDDHDHEHEEHVEHDDHDHDHEHEEHAEHDDHDHDHEHEEHAEHDDHDHDHEHEEHAGEFDQHYWLDPENAKIFVNKIRDILVIDQPNHAETIMQNTDKMVAELDQLTVEIHNQLEAIQGKGFIVFHDAYQHFENRFKVKAIGSILLNPEVPPSAERISEIRHKLKESTATCVFSEPQFQSKLVDTVTEGTNTKTGQLDPLGASLKNGPRLYFELIKNIASEMTECLNAKNL